MSHEAWPSPDAVPGPLPRLEDLPLAEQGYEQESVRLAFDAFYRHAAQLDASLRALEAVEAFRRDADALRNDLRALRALAGAGMASERSWTSERYERVGRDVSATVLRLGAEAALIIAVAVVAGVAHFRSTVIVALMAGAFVIVVLSEWLAARARFVPPAVAFLPPLEGREPAPYVEAPVPEWGPPPPLEPGDDTEADALTVVEAPAPAVEEEPELGAEEEPVAPDPWEEPAQDEAEPERVGLFRRRRR
jgi:hypothetical protein